MLRASLNGMASCALRSRGSADGAIMSDHGESRWAGRNGAKAIVRDRVWSRLVEAEVNVGPAFDRIPNFVGADIAAKRLGELDAWKRARVVKCNPDPPQIPVRLRALYDGKLLFSPVPYLTEGFPYLRIDPEKLVARGVDFETAATAQGFKAHGEPIGFEDMPKLDFCVVGCVAVTRRGGRTGKGAGFADLEQGVFRELGLVDAMTPIATTVHSSQVVDESDVVMESHDSALDHIATELELITTHTSYPQPSGVDWDKVRADQFADIPFLNALRQSIENRKRRS
jgi:5-formyltetrahydrofolate cyclo-ligase